MLPGLVDAHGHLMHLARGRLELRRARRRLRGGGRPPGRRARRHPAARRVDHRPQLGPEPVAGPAIPHAGPRSTARRPTTRWRSCASTATRRGRTRRRWPRPASSAPRPIRRAASSPATPRGEATGLLIDTAQRLLQRVEPRPSDEQFDRAVRECVADCLAVGLTGIHEMGAELYALAAYRRLLERGDFPFRNYVAVAARSASTWDHYRQRGPETARRRPGDRRRAQAPGRRRARLAGRRAARRLLRRSRQHGPGAGARRGGRAADAGGRRARLPGVRARHRRSRQHAGARRLRARAGPRAPPRPPPARGARPDPHRGRRPPLPAARRAAEHAGHPLHLRHGVGGRAARPRAPARRLRVALAAGHGRRASPAAPTSRSRAPTRSTASTPRSPGGRATARIPAGSPSSG